MADTTTELEVLDQIVDVLGGQSGQYETVVPTLQQILALLGGGGGGSGSGYNPSLSVGRADALTGADSTAQWATRESEGTGSATVRSVQGAAVGWNQIVSDASAHKSGTSASNTWLYSANFTMTSGHKYLLVRSGTYGLYTNTCRVVSTTGTTIVYRGVPNIPNKQGVIFECTETRDNYYVQAWVVSGADYDFYLNVFDLTAMFGSGNEPTTVTEFEAMYPASYYPYSAPTLKPVQIAGIASTDAQGGELDAIEWPTFTLRGAGNIGDMLYSDHVETRVGVLALTGNEPASAYTYTTYSGFLLSGALPESDMRKAYSSSDFGTADNGTVVPNTEQFAWLGVDNTSVYLLWANCPYATAADLTAWLRQRYADGNPVTFFYELATPTTTPISPALPMTYRVEQGGSESVIVPAGEISAAPVLTIAEGESAADVVMDALACIATPDGPVATANHALGTYLTMQGKLYKVTSAIAVGESIAAGTNVTQTTVMAELLALTA